MTKEKEQRIIVVTSGKGGVGKTTTAANFAMSLALEQKKTVVIDFDVGLRNLDIVLGCERRIVFDIINVINREAKLTQALIRDKRVPNLYVLPASQTRDKDALTIEGVEEILDELLENFDYIVCDSPAGIEKGAQLAFYFAHAAIIVVTPELPSLRDSDRIIGLMQKKSAMADIETNPIEPYLIINRYDPERVKNDEMLGIDDIEDMLVIPLLGVIPESPTILEASNSGEPVVYQKPLPDVGAAYRDATRRFLGEDIPLRFTEPERKGLFSSILKFFK